MLYHFPSSAATINRDIIFSFHSTDVGNLGIEKSFWRDTHSLPEFDIMNYQSHRKKTLINPESSGQNTSENPKVFSTEDHGFNATQEFADTLQLPTSLFNNEDDILNLDADIPIPDSHESGTIRVKLIYEEPSKPLPVEDPWED